MHPIQNLALDKKTQEMTIKGKLTLYGYSFGDKPIKIDRDLLEAARVLMVMPETGTFNDNIKNRPNETQIKEFAKTFFERFFRLHPVKTISNEEYQEICLHYVSKGGKPENLLDMCNTLNLSSKSVMPYELPISYITSTLPLVGTVQKPSFLKPNEKYLKKQNVYFSKIILGNPITEITPYSYIHEIIHTQVESVKGSVRDYRNSELLPIFVELLAVYETSSNKEVLNYIINARLRDILEKISLIYTGKGDPQSLLLYATYVKSTLQALQLFDIYTNSEQEIKQEIINGIQNIFDGKLVLEDFLTKYTVSIGKSSNPELIRKYMNNYKK